MTSLFSYMKDVTRFLKDGNQELINPGDLIEYVNRARREVAMRSECLRVLPATSGSVQTITVTAGGTDPTTVLHEAERMALGFNRLVAGADAGISEHLSHCGAVPQTFVLWTRRPTPLSGLESRP